MDGPIWLDRYGWIDMDGSIWMDLYGWMDMDGRTDGRMDGCMDGLMNMDVRSFFLPHTFLDVRRSFRPNNHLGELDVRRAG